MIIKSSVIPKTDSYVMSMSPRLQVSTTIDSRSLRREQEPYQIQMYNPFNLLELDFDGGTRFSEVTLKRGEHWNEGLKQEKTYLDSLNPSDRRQFMQRLNVMDYARSAAMIAFNDLVNSHPHLIKTNGDLPETGVELPFNFSAPKTTKYALETFLLKYAPRKTIREVTGHPTGNLTLAEIDNSSLGHNITTNVANDYHRAGLLPKGVLLKNKSFSPYHWATIQALEEHFFDQGRRFQGYSLEFVGTPDQTVSIVFDLPPNSSKSGKNVSSRIIYDERTKLPKVLYKVFDPEAYANKWHLLNRSAREMTNISEDRQRSRHVKKYQERDWRTGRRALCTIREPTDDILRRHCEIIDRAHCRHTTLWDRRGLYIQASKE